MPFTDRVDAGRRLAAELTTFRGSDVVVLGLPRGGVPVAFEVARALHAPLDVLVVRKLGLPGRPELAMGAIGEDGTRVLNAAVLASSGVTHRQLAEVEHRERAELERRTQLFRRDYPRVPLVGRTALVVDDGVATGSTARVGCQLARRLGAARVILAVPVGSPATLAALRAELDDVVCLESSDAFAAVGQWYVDFAPTSDDEVVDLLRRARGLVRPGGDAAAPDDPPLYDEEVVAVGDLPLQGHLTVPAQPCGLVVFAHGSGSSRHSPRNRHVAAVLNRAGFGTFLFDLLSRGEEGDRSLVFDIGWLAERLAAATRWTRSQPVCAGLRLGYFGASTGAAAAMMASTHPGVEVHAIVSRGGRPDLAASALAEVRAPTLLIVGGGDRDVLELNRRALRLLGADSDLAVVPGATHLFAEPGALDAAAALARDWFVDHLAPLASRTRGRSGARP